jgi:DNA-binding response OmpR family regulator
MSKKKLLIIDDDVEMCEEISEILRDEGYDVGTVHDGLEGRALLLREHFDLVLLDIKIPGMNGFEVLNAIREANISVKVIVLSGRPMVKELSGKPSTYDEEEAILKKADSVMGKPYDIVKVLETTKKLLSQ